MVCSSSISNFREKLKKRTELKEYKFPKDIFKPAIFFGLYHIFDYLKFAIHLGDKRVFWCGADITYLEENFLLRGNFFWRFLFFHIRAKHFCENEVERLKLMEMGINSDVTPMIFDDPSKYQISYKPSDTPKVFATYHKGREEEYGVFQHPQVDWFCDLSEEEFNEKIKSYQGCLRINKFDGFAESLAKSVLMGQYQFSVYIPYEYMESSMLFREWLDNLVNKDPNYEAEKYWRKILEANLNKVLYE
jgi:hypothetical protein